ncbi:MAG TPA: hypothetical protein VJT32_02710 [bacterium]|nr:hypothetical protein [bacterium]
MRSRVLGLSVGSATVAAALVEGTSLQWAGTATYSELADLSEVIARLAGEAGKPVKRVRVGLARDVVQVRTVRPAPPLKARDVSRYVDLEGARLFRKNGVPLVVGGVLVAVTKTERALWVAAATEPLLKAIVDGCTQGGMTIEAMAPSAETLPAALDIAPGVTEVVVPNGRTTETLSVGVGGVWQSRWTRGLKERTGTWVPALAESNGDSPAVAPAYAAGIQLPTLSLLPDGPRAARRRMDRRRLAAIASAGAVLWVLAGVVFLGRLSAAHSRATTLLQAFRGAADSALEARRNLNEGRATLAMIAAARANRSRMLSLLAGLTKALSDSVTLVALQVTADRTVRITGLAPRATQALAQVGRVPELTGAAFDGAVTHEAVAGIGDRDRFTIVARLVRP